MKLIQISENFTPLDDGVLFSVNAESEAPADIRLDIVDSVSGMVVATQQLREVRRAKVNIAPYIERFAERTPSHYPYTSFSEAPTAIHHIRVDEICSYSVITSVNRVQVTTPTLLTAMPRQRCIAYGESDEVMIFAEEGALISATVTTDWGEELSLDYTSTSGAAIFTLASADFDTECRKIDVTIACNGTPLGSLRYNLAPRHKCALRLAWISERGTIERYTFPTPVSVTRKGDERTVTIQSHYEPRAVVEALAQIVASPKVWVERNGSFCEVKVATSTLEYTLFGEPDSIALTLLAEGGEEALW